ncbi:MAG: hypothetical protein EOR41_33290, partial [Mesorhizobium sp.]
MTTARPAGQRPPLSCRTSPPQGGRSDLATAFANRRCFKGGASARTANLPPRGPVALFALDGKRRSGGGC